MKGNNYIVTGGGSGTGRTTAAKLTSLGANVEIWGRTENKLSSAVDEGVAEKYRVVDISKADEIKGQFNAIIKANKSLSGVVHCAGIWTPGGLTEIDDKKINDHINIVALGSVYVAKYAAKILTNSGGTIVLIAAASAKAGFKDTALNTLAKRAVDGLQESFSRELRDKNVKLTTIYPDSISSNDSEAVKNGKAISYNDLAETIIFALNSPKTARIEEIILTALRTGR